MSGYTRIAGAIAVALVALALSALLPAMPEAVRWSLLICLLGFLGATLRLRHLDAGL